MSKGGNEVVMETCKPKLPSVDERSSVKMEEVRKIVEQGKMFEAIFEQE